MSSPRNYDAAARARRDALTKRMFDALPIENDFWRFYRLIPR